MCKKFPWKERRVVNRVVFPLKSDVSNKIVHVVVLRMACLDLIHAWYVGASLARKEPLTQT